MSVGLNQVLVASAALLAIGAFTTVARRSLLIALFGIQFMLLAGGIAFVAFGRFGLGAQSQTSSGAMALLVGTSAIGQLVVGLAMAAVVYRERRSLAVDADRE